MAATLNAIRAGLKVRLVTIAGLRVVEQLPDQISPPLAFIGVPGVVSYHSAMAQGLVEYAPTITVFTSTAVDRTGQDRLAEYANVTGVKSVRVAVEGDRTLGGTVSDCVVMSFRLIGVNEFGPLGYYGGVFTLKCVASGV